MYQTEPQMAVGFLFVILAGLLVVGALTAVIIGLVLVSTKGGRILLGLGFAALLGMLLIAASFWMVATSRDVQVARTTEVAWEDAKPWDRLEREEEHRQISVDETHQIAAPEASPAEATSAPDEREPVSDDPVDQQTLPVDQQTTAEPANSPTLPARTVTTYPSSPFPNIPRPPIPSDFYQGGPRFPRFASSSSDMQREIDRMREETRRRMYEHLEARTPNGPYEPPVTSQSSGTSDPSSLYNPESTETDSAESPTLAPSSIIPPGRPQWVEQSPEWEDENTYVVAVSSGPYNRGTDCRRELDREIDQAIDEFANELLNSTDAARLIGPELDALKETVLAETYREELSSTVGPMQQWHSLLRFGGDVQQKIREFWQAQQQVSRIVYIGAGFLALLGLLSVCYIGMTFTGEGSQVSPWVVSAGTVVALGSLLAIGVIFVRSFPML